MRLALAVLVLTLATLSTGGARAQSYFAFELPIAPEGPILGAIHDAPVTLVRWAGADGALVRYEDAEVRIETPARLRTAEGQARIAVGVGRASRVSAGPWQISMDAGAWAPLRGHEGEAPRITLPRGMPRAHGVLAPEGTTTPRPTSPFSHTELPSTGLEVACRGQLSIRARPHRSAPRWAVPAGALYRVHGERAPLRVEVHLEGFVVTGHVDATPAPCLAELGASGMGVGCGDGVLHGLAVSVPAGTPLYASPASSAPFAWVLRDVVAREQRDMPRARRCTSVAGAEPSCQLDPPPPTGPQTLFFTREPDAGGDRWSFAAEVRVPFETLRLVEGASGGVGGCSTSLEWPD